jgi:hypothetical protein
VKDSLKYQLCACGKKGLPQQIEFNGAVYKLQKVFKHDFFAATGLYRSSSRPAKKRASTPARVVLKLGRQQHLLGLPMAWVGRFFCDHEVSILRRLEGLAGVPRFLSLYGDTGFICEYINANSLDNQNKLPRDFFNKLANLLQQVHQRDVAYLDMNKRDNILIDRKGRPYLIDFQISLHVGKSLLVWPGLSDYMRNILQGADIYHLYKHKRKLAPELLTPEEDALSRNVGPWISIHRTVATPWRKIRRAALKLLRNKGIIADHKDTA